MRANALLSAIPLSLGIACGAPDLHRFKVLQSEDRSRIETAQSSEQTPTNATDTGSVQSVDVSSSIPDGTEGPSKDGGGTIVTTPTGTIIVTPKPPGAALAACAPKGGPLVGTTLTFDTTKGGPLVINGDATGNSIDVSGGGSAGVVRIVTGDVTKALLVPCVTSVTLNGNDGNDILRVGDGFPGVTSFRIFGGAGANDITLYGAISTSVSIN